MTKKQRAIDAVKFKTVDKIPTQYRGIKYLTESLMKYFKIRDYKNLEKNYKGLLKNLGADFFSSGDNIAMFSTFNPVCNAPVIDSSYIKEASYFYVLGIKATVKTIDKYDFSYSVFDGNPPLGGIENASELKAGFLMSKLDYFDFNKFVNRRLFEEWKSSGKNPGDLAYEKFKDSSDDFINMGALNEIFIICSYLRGMENFLTDIAFNKRLAEAIVKEVGDFCLEFNRRELKGFGKKAEWYSMWDDVAGQYGLMFSPDIFKKFFLPVYKALIANAKKYNLIFSWHCCGNVNEILPFMIDAGIDVFDVVQTSAKDMELENIHKLYGKSVCLHGGIDVQKLLIQGSPASIKEEVKKVIDLWGNNGGVILGPSHEALPETPIENVLAIYESFRSN